MLVVFLYEITMAILQSPYDARVCVAYRTNKIADAVVLAHLNGNTGGHHMDRVQTLDIEGDATSMVPSFTLPLVVERDGVKTVYLDMRSLTSYDPRVQQLRIRNKVEYDAKLILGGLIADWVDGHTERFLINSPVCLAVFASMVGEAIAKRVGADAMTQLRISVLAAIHYMNCFVNQEEQESRDYKARLISMMTRHCGYRGDEVTAVVSEYYNINGLDELCEAIKAYTQNRRLDDLNPSTLLEYVGAYWYGNNGKELIAVALEYPPMWMFLVFLSFTDRSYRNTRLFAITDRNTYKRMSEGFLRSMLARGVQA